MDSVPLVTITIYQLIAIKVIFLINKIVALKFKAENN
jgi:hypothetical protein